VAGRNTDAIQRELDRIRSLDLAELRAEWKQHNRGVPPKLSRDLLALALGYQLQEREYGGLSKSTRRKLQGVEKALKATGRVSTAAGLALKSGVRLVREWRSRVHTVTVTDDGFEHEGVSYSSLSLIARKITGAHWSGPRFFGLSRNALRQRNAGEATDG
jgi:hypothetical protein